MKTHLYLKSLFLEGKLHKDLDLSSATSSVHQLVQALKCTGRPQIKETKTAWNLEFLLLIFAIPLCIVESHQGWDPSLPNAA